MNLTSAIINRLREAGIRAFLPGAHEGICVSPYCVVQLYSGTLSTPRGGYARYRVHIFAPAAQPELLEPLADDVRAALLSLEQDGSFQLAQPRGATVTEDAYRAVSSYIDYVSYYSEMKGSTT